MMIREPAVAGIFYPRQPGECAAEVLRCVNHAENRAPARAQVPAGARILGGIVPHAGWIYSGAVAACVFVEMGKSHPPATIVLFGAVHGPHSPRAAVFPSGAWETPLGLANIDERLAGRLLGQTNLLDADPHAHEAEHSIEVQVPFIQHLMPDARIVPILVPADDKAASVGTAVGRTCKTYGADVAFVGSTDLTHYGPSYQFTPQGVGPAGLAWAKAINDQRMIRLVLALRAEDAVEEAAANDNACGAGAIAATIAACRACGATTATLLEHTSSHEVLSEHQDEQPRDSVGYAAVVFH